MRNTHPRSFKLFVLWSRIGYELGLDFGLIFGKMKPSYLVLLAFQPANYVLNSRLKRFF